MKKEKAPLTKEEEEAKAKRRKIRSWILDGILGAILIFFVTCEIMMLASTDKRSGTRYLFGYSGMVVLTDSMAGTLDVGSGIIVQKVDPSTLRGIEYSDGGSVSDHLPESGNPIYMDSQIPEAEQGTYTVTYPGDIISFYGYLGTTAQGEAVYQTITHRLIEIVSDAYGTKTYYCYGDNDHATTCPIIEGKDTEDTSDDVRHCSYVLNRNRVVETDILGKVVSHNDALGKLFQLSMNPFFFPMLALVPLLILGAMYLIDFIRKDLKAEKEENAQLALAIQEAGIDTTDATAMAKFEERWRYEQEIKEEIQRIREEEEEEVRHLMEKERKRARKEIAKAQKAQAKGKSGKKSEYQRILEEEMAKARAELSASSEENKKE